jgi:hypothetical protein
MLASTQLDAAAPTGAWALDPPLVLAARTCLSAPGRCPGWTRAHRRGHRSPGGSRSRAGSRGRFRTSRATTTAASRTQTGPASKRSARRSRSRRIFFARLLQGSRPWSQPDPQARARSPELGGAASAAGAPVRVEVVGRGDSEGTDDINLSLSPSAPRRSSPL